MRMDVTTIMRSSQRYELRVRVKEAGLGCK